MAQFGHRDWRVFPPGLESAPAERRAVRRGPAGFVRAVSADRRTPAADSVSRRVARQVFDDVADDLLGVPEQHECVRRVVELVLDAGESRIHAPLDRQNVWALSASMMGMPKIGLLSVRARD